MTVTARPRRLRVVCWAGAAVIVAMSVLIAVLLRGKTEGGGAFLAGDQAAMVGLGVLFAAGVLVFTRPRLDADERGVRIRNLVGSYDLPWEIITAVRFDDGSPWAALDLADDDQVAVMAVQAVDREYAATAVAGLRELLALRQAARD